MHCSKRQGHDHVPPDDSTMPAPNVPAQLQGNGLNDSDSFLRPHLSIRNGKSNARVSHAIQHTCLTANMMFITPHERSEVMDHMPITIDASSALVNASALATVLFITSDGLLSLNIDGRSDRMFVSAPLTGEKAFQMDYRNLPANRADVLPLDLDRIEAVALALRWRRGVSICAGALLVTSEGTHIVLDQIETGSLVRVNLATRAWEYVGNNEVGLVADSWTLNGYGDGRVILSTPCVARTA